jgi:zinc transporter
LLRLLNRPPQWLQKEDVKELRKSTEEFALIINDLTALGERIKLLQEEIAANLNEQSNRTLFTLTGGHGAGTADQYHRLRHERGRHSAGR